MKRFLTRCGLILASAALAGCGAGYDAATSEPEAAQQQQAPAANVAAAGDEAPVEPEMVREEAKAGVGAKGRFEGEGLIVTPLKTYFLAKEKIAFDIQIASAMQLYKGEHGYAPKSHDDFMDKIVKQNQIVLPELPEGHRYVYDPQQEQLMVEHPR